MTIKRLVLSCLFVLHSAFCGMQYEAVAQQPSTTQKQLQLSAVAAKEYKASLHLLPTEDEQESGNAVPVILRMTYEQQSFMKDVYPRLDEFAAMDIHDPKLQELGFNRFAEQIIRAGSMSFADWQYPLRSENPYLIMLPDIQAQRRLVGRGMTAWIKQRLAAGDMDGALKGIKAQLGCGRHCAETPIVICHLVGLAIASTAFDNLELAMQSDQCPNMYWSLAALSPTLHELGPMVRWELWASPARLKEPIPSIGSEEWTSIARKFADLMADVSDQRYSQAEGESLQKNMDRLAKQELSKTIGFTESEIDRMSTEERIMRWLDLHYHRFRSFVEPLAYQSPSQVIAAKKKIETTSKELITAVGAKSSPFPDVLPQAILACRNFERRVKFLQTLESLRDYASKHDGGFPQKLDDLDLIAPNDPFTEKPFLYEVNGKKARLRQAEIDGNSTPVCDYELELK